MNPMTEAPWWLPLGTAVIGALTAALVGGWFVVRRNEKWKLEQQTDFRADLVADMARTAQALRMESNVYRRKVIKGEFRDQLATDQAKLRLEERYVSSRVEGDAISARLQSHFGDDLISTVINDWHAVMDCATLLYFDSLDRNTEEIRSATRRSDTAEHSGLTDVELMDRDVVTEVFRHRLAKATKGVVGGRLTVPD